MKNFVIVTDSCADLTKEIIEKNNIYIMDIMCTLNDKECYVKNDNDLINFYKEIEKGAIANTSQLNPFQIKTFFNDLIKKNLDIVYISFSGNLSGCKKNAEIVAAELMEENKDVNIKIIDSLCASIGLGLLVVKAIEFKKKCNDINKLVEYVENLKLKINHLFVLDNLKYLIRSGRISKAKGMIVNLSNIKLVMHCNKEGKLTPINRIMGRKKSLLNLIEYMKNNIEGYLSYNKKIYIGHSNCLEDAKFLKLNVEKAFNVNVEILNIGHIIGANCGIGTVALFFIGKERKE